MNEFTLGVEEEFMGGRDLRGKGSRLRRAPRAGREEEENLMKREEQAEMSEGSGETGRRAQDFLRRVRPVVRETIKSIKSWNRRTQEINIIHDSHCVALETLNTPRVMNDPS